MTATRRLAAILAADVVGYSRLMGVDEEGMLARLKTLRSETIDPTIAAHHGRIVKTTGDGLLVEFGSVVDSVRCAAALQRALAERNAGEEPARRIELRIGVNLGDIIIDGDDIHGDGVNVAARLEALAEPGSVYVSGTAHDHVRDKLDQAFEDLGERELKNIARKVRVYRIAASPAPAARPALPLPDKPSLAVLPFANMTGDKEQEYFADGMVEDITTALSRIRQFFVIARNSSFAYKGKSIDVKQIGRELGVRYLLEGSVRKAGDRVRITGQLIDAETGAHLWADKYDSALEDIFDLQDRVTASVAGAIEPSITRAEIERSRRKPPENLQAYDYLLRAIDESRAWTRDGFDRALQLARQAMALDQRYALAYSYVARWHASRSNSEWMENAEVDTAEGLRFAHLAVGLEPNDPVVLAHAAWALAFLNGELEMAVSWVDRAVTLNPNSALGYGESATVHCFRGDYEIAADHATRAMRLSPYDPMFWAFCMPLGLSHLFRRNPAESVEWLRKSAQQNPNHAGAFLFLSSGLAHLGRLDEARAVMRRVLEIRPATSVTRQRRRGLYKITSDLEYFLEGARMAGLPD